MSILGSLFGTDDNNENQNKTNKNSGTNNTSGQQKDEGTLQLRKEELDINKNKVETGEVILSKEVVEEQQTVNVPVTHEEVVIERKQLNNQPTDSQISSSSSSSSDWNSSSDTNSCSDCGCESNNNTSETIRIPVTEERVDVGKHTVVTEEVSAYKRDVEQTQKVEQTLKREEAHIDKNGNAVVNNNTTSGSNTSSDNTRSDNNSSSDNDKSDSWF